MCLLVGWWVSVGVPEVLLVVLWHEVGGRVGLQVARQARAARVVRRRWGSDSSNAAYTTAVGHIFMLEMNEKKFFFFNIHVPLFGNILISITCHVLWIN